MGLFSFKLNGQPVSEPVGWDEINFNVIRSEQHGIDQPFTSAVTFTGDLDKQRGFENGARILRLAWENEFINASVDVEIETDFKVDGQSWSFVGKIDFSTYSETNICDGCSDGVEVSIIQDDFRERFRQRSGVEFDIRTTTDLDGNPIDPITFRVVRLHSQELYLKAFGRSYQQETDEIVSSSPSIFDQFRVIPTFWVNSDFQGNYPKTFDTKGPVQDGFNVCFVNNLADTRQMTVSGTGSYRVNPSGSIGTGGPVTFQVFIRVFEVGTYGTGTTYPNLYVSPFCPIGVNTDGEFDFETTVPVPAGYGIAIQWAHSNLGGWSLVETEYSFFDDVRISLSEISSSTASLAKGLLVHDFLNRMAYVMTGQQNRVLSSFFESETGCMWNNLITTGLQIRNIDEINNAPIQVKAQWDKVFESLNRVFCLGWEFEQNAYGDWFIRVEPADYFYQPTIAAEFENVAEIKRYSLVEKLYNSMQLGYNDKWKNIAIQGAFALHTDRTYYVDNRAMNRNSSNNLDLRSDIVAEGVTIEFLRRLQFLKEDSASSDRPNDYDLFLIWLNPETVTINPIEDSGYGFPEETGSVTFSPGTVSFGSDLIGSNNSPLDRVYNVLHTPMRVASRWWKWLGQQTFKLPTDKQKLRFASGQYFTDFAMAVPDPCGEILSSELSENENVGPDTLNAYSLDYLVQPIGYEIEVPQELCDFLTLANNGKQLVKFRCGSSVFAGYIINGENQPSGDNGGLSNFTLIGADLPVTLSNRIWGPQFGPQFE